VDFSLDITDLKTKFGPAERHLIERLLRSSPPAIRSCPTTWC
jgi:hypothetical protein